MPEWIVVVISGGVGGFVGTFLPAGTDVRFPGIIGRVVEGSASLEFLAHIMRNTVFGGLAGFLLWAGYSPAKTFSSIDVTTNQVALSIIFGGGGIAIVNNLFRQAERNADLSRALDALVRAIKP